MLATYAPSLTKLPTTNGDFATGDGVRLGMAVGAATRDMQYVQVHPTAFIDPKNAAAKTKFLAPEALRGSGAIFGVRFVLNPLPGTYRHSTVPGTITPISSYFNIYFPIAFIPFPGLSNSCPLIL